MPSKRRPSRASLVERKRAGIMQVRKTVYFLPTTIERLERHAFHHRLSLWEVVEVAVTDYLNKVAPIQTRRRGPAVPSPQSAPYSQPSAPTPARSRRQSSTVPSPQPAPSSPPPMPPSGPPSTPPSTRRAAAPRSKKT